MAIQFDKRLFTVQEYHKMLDAGILDEDDRVELIDGEIVQMAPIRMRHIMCVNRLVRLLSREEIPQVAFVSPQNSLILNDGTEVQPDIALLRIRDYRDEELAPRADDALLVIEVAESTVSEDRRVKAPRYARSGISVYWLVNLPKGTIDVYTEPGTGAYERIARAKRGDVLEIPGFPDVSIRVDDILG